jgi:formylglycine-generating enzyme required for sulfatase activity
MHGNAAEWTRSTYQGALSQDADPSWNAENENPSALKTVRGGSWRDRPQRCRSSFRLAYPAFQRVFNVGFRIAVED